MKNTVSNRGSSVDDSAVTDILLRSTKIPECQFVSVQLMADK